MKPTVPEAIPLVVAVLKRDMTGCCLHVCMSDPNDYPCGLEQSRRLGHADCEAAAVKIAEMSPTQIRKLRAMAWAALR